MSGHRAYYIYIFVHDSRTRLAEDDRVGSKKSDSREDVQYCTRDLHGPCHSRKLLPRTCPGCPRLPGPRLGLYAGLTFCRIEYMHDFTTYA